MTNQLKQQNEEFREALETIADVLEDVGILDGEETAEIAEEEEPPDGKCKICGEDAVYIHEDGLYCEDHHFAQWAEAQRAAEAEEK